MKLTMLTIRLKKMKCLYRKVFLKTKKFLQAITKIIRLKSKKIINLINYNPQIRKKKQETNKPKMNKLC